MSPRRSLCVCCYRIASVVLIVLTVTCYGQDQTIDCNEKDKDCDWVTLKDRRGLIQSPNYPQLYPAHKCSGWTIEGQGQPNDVITISFEDLDIPYQDDCSAGYIEIGPVPSRKLCGSLNTSSPVVYISRRNHGWIRFCSVGWDSGRGFSLRYKIAANATKNDCQPDEIQCSYGKCILERWKCNGAAECEDASDEQGCTSFKHLTTPGPLACGESNFGCFDARTKAYRCFLKNKLCDNHVDCDDGIDEKTCPEQNCTFHLEGPNGFFHSPNYPHNYGNNAHCTWTIHVKYGSIVQLRFIEFAIQNEQISDYLRIYDGSSASHPLLGVFYGRHKPSHVLNATGNRMYLEFISDGSITEMGFNISYQIKGECMSHQHACKYGEDDCYDQNQRCDGVWDCPKHGGDERGCGNCEDSRFQCGKYSSQCYAEAERCNGQFHCTEHKADEANCTPEECGPHMGTFLCDNRLCIYESWLCDGQDDCQDFSDEIHCSRPSVKVITAAVIGSLICGLLLVIALGCTCKLYAMRMQEHTYSSVAVSPSVHEHAAMWARVFAPPPYPEAMVTSRSYEEVRQEILRRERRSRRAREGRGRSGRRHRSQHPENTASAASQTNGGQDDVALLDLAGGEGGDVRCIDMGSIPEEGLDIINPSYNCDDDDSDSDDSDLQDCDQAVEINIAQGVQWHRHLPKQDAPLQTAGVSVQTDPLQPNMSLDNSSDNLCENNTPSSDTPLIISSTTVPVTEQILRHSLGPQERDGDTTVVTMPIVYPESELPFENDENGDGDHSQTLTDPQEAPSSETVPEELLELSPVADQDSGDDVPLLVLPPI